MRPFQFQRPTTTVAATDLAGVVGDSHVAADVQYIGGGTTLLDLMKLDVMRPKVLVDLSAIADDELRSIAVGPGGTRIGAMATMAEVAAHEGVRRTYPMIAQSLELAASAQLRNMARVGGNLLQRTRCSYFRDVSWPCNKREPGSGCSAMEGVNRQHAVLGTSDSCIASYPGDFAQALVALDAVLEIVGPSGPRALAVADLHRMPDDSPHIETTLAPGEIITGINLPVADWLRRSVYLKIRDRESYAFALTSAAVALDLSGGAVRDVRIALGGVATKPWRAVAAEAELRGRSLDDVVMEAAAKAAFRDAEPREHNTFKVYLGQQTIVRALRHVRDMEI